MKNTSPCRDLWLDMEAAFDSVMEDGCAYQFHEAAAAMLRLIAVRMEITRPADPFLWLCREAENAKQAKRVPD
jgi:hypothetical protein